eukprot:scaffold3894_cov127-Isochrysis_galbana.AAC.3
MKGGNRRERGARAQPGVWLPPPSLQRPVDEDFRLVQQQLKQTVRELLTAHLKGKLPLKGDGDIAALVRARIAGVLQEDEWMDIEYRNLLSSSVRLSQAGGRVFPGSREAPYPVWTGRRVLGSTAGQRQELGLSPGAVMQPRILDF